MNLLLYLQMKKVQMKLNYFNEFDKLIQSDNQQLRTVENQLIQDRIKVSMRKLELNELIHKKIENSNKEPTPTKTDVLDGGKNTNDL